MKFFFDTKASGLWLCILLLLFVVLPDRKILASKVGRHHQEVHDKHLKVAQQEEGADENEDLETIELFRDAFGEEYVKYYNEYLQSDHDNHQDKEHRVLRRRKLCPANGGNPVTLNLGINVIMKSYSSDLCVVFKSANDHSYIEPVARSHDQNDFILTGGSYHEKLSSSDLSVLLRCRPDRCLLRIPQERGVPQDFTYTLHGYDHSLDDKSAMARFLEQATFGTTRQDLETIETEFSNNIQAWMYHQMYDTPLTSFREYLRKRRNPRLVLPIITGAGGPSPCDQNSRWRRFAFTIKDQKRYLTVTSYNNDDQYPYLLWVDGIPRTFTSDFTFVNSDLDFVANNLFGAPMEICQSDTSFAESVGRYFAVKAQGNKCEEITNGVPPVDLSPDESLFLPLNVGSNGPALMDPIDNTDYSSKIAFQYRLDIGDEYILTNDFEPSSCQSLLDSVTNMESWGPYIKAMFPDDHGSDPIYLMYDEHLIMLENTVENPSPDGGGSATEATEGYTQCANVVRDFTNEDTCFVSSEPSACSASRPPEFKITLNEDTLRGLYNTANRFVYAVQNLPLQDDNPDETHADYLYPPCERGKSRHSRWLQVDRSYCNDNYRTVQPLTESNIIQLINDHEPTDGNANLFLRDITLRTYYPCDEADEALWDLGYILDSTNDVCWQHVHPLHMNVYDFTAWSSRHPGGFNAIAQWTESPILIFPTNHHFEGNVRFFENVADNPFSDIPLIGRYGDTIPYYDLPNNLQTPEFASQYGELQSNKLGEGILICGSEGEVANDPTLGSGFELKNFVVYPNGERDDFSTTGFGELRSQRTTIWSMIALSANDQLRQRVAWALSQILVVSPELVTGSDLTEPHVKYYDIFVRGAFGSYRDILKRVAFDLTMGHMLSSLNNRSFQYSLERYNIHAYPDENFAREIMQLFTIGLYKLKPDGTPVYENGRLLEVYDNEDILSGARAWTGFDDQTWRGNVENEWLRNDPMFIQAEWRDQFPKKDLYGGYIGDRYPLCIDQPDQQFLKKGATYRLMGSNPKPELHEEHSRWDEDPLIIRMELDEDEELASILCSPSGEGDECTFPAKVVLDHTVACGSATCEVGTLRTVKIASSPVPIYYEYVRPPCVEHAFYENGVRIVDYVHWPYRANYLMCADPRRDVASEACCVEGWEAVYDEPTCCESGWDSVLRNVGKGYRHCHFNGERMSYTRAQQRCIDNGQSQCEFARILEREAGICFMPPWIGGNYHWSNAPCSIMAKIAPDGKVAIVHDPQPDWMGNKPVPNKVSEDTLNYFWAPWEGQQYPTIANGCNNLASCTIVGNACLCSTTTIDEPAFTINVPTRADVLDNLFIGAVNPDVSDLDYRMLSCGVAGVDVYTTAVGSCNNLDETTIFRVIDDNGVERWLKNMYSQVYITGENYSFRNPVHFISLVDPEKRDMYHEIDAVLDQYFYHPNHPPFLATRMIQRFGISNPSPSFVLAVSEAYRAGSYTSNGITFGNGEYGDLGAMVAAILLHSESRSVALDADPTYGSLKEPLLKVIGYMRSMEYIHEAPLAVPMMAGLNDRIGQGAFEVQSVFSFFLPEFRPPGVLGTAGLVSPEAQVLTSTKVTNLVDGLLWLTKIGLSHCGTGSSGLTGWYRGSTCKWPYISGDYSQSLGHLTYSPSESVVTAEDLVDELALLMTSSRLRRESRDLIVGAIEQDFATDVARAVMIAQQLIVTTPEFHVTTLVRDSGIAREIPPEEELGTEPYKAVVYLYFSGGMDSYNLLVPKCEDMFADYEAVRGVVALDPSNLIDITTSGEYRHGDQPCSTFGVNDAFPVLADLYNDGDALFFANTGVLETLVDKDNWETTDSTLFAHNTQEQETLKLDIEGEFDDSGVVGRMLDVLKVNGYQTSAASIDRGSLAVTGIPEYSNPVVEVSRNNPTEFNRFPTSDDVSSLLPELNAATNRDSSLFGETFSSTLLQGLQDNAKKLEINDNPDFDLNTEFPDTNIGDSMAAIAKWMKAREFRKVTRDGLFIEQGGYDLHAVDVSNDDYLEFNLQEMNDALEAFVAELKDQGIWEDTVIVTASDFARTLTPNSGDGTDHAWGGNYALIGGSVNGGKILGEFPDTYAEEGALNIGRGRLVPTTPWDAVWLGVSQFMGVTEDTDLDFVIPNRHAFDGCHMYPDGVTFVGGRNPSSCT